MAYGRKTGGRAPGTPNRTTAAMREAILEAFERAGGVEYLVGVARSTPAVFCQLLARLLPRDVRVQDQGATLEEIITRSWEVGAGRDGADRVKRIDRS